MFVAFSMNLFAVLLRVGFRLSVQNEFHIKKKKLDEWWWCEAVAARECFVETIKLDANEIFAHTRRNFN